MNSHRSEMHAGEAVVEAIREEGRGAVYSVPRSHIHPIYDGLSHMEGLKFVTVKQEPNASLMADTYGRLTGKPGVCLVTAGPGSVNSAYSAASPMAHISAAVPPTTPNFNHFMVLMRQILSSRCFAQLPNGPRGSNDLKTFQRRWQRHPMLRAAVGRLPCMLSFRAYRTIANLSYKKSPHPSLNTNDVGRLSLSLLRAMSSGSNANCWG
jgi:hypothetical protein